jgi:hypothetical protein
MGGQFTEAKSKKNDKIDVAAAFALIREKRAQRAKWGAPGPPINALFAGHRVVASHNELLRGLSPNATYHDFLPLYLEQVFGKDWWGTELAKPADSRHELISWNVAAAEYRALRTTSKVGLNEAPMSAESAHLLRLAYNLHQIRHQGMLQESLIKRLKVPLQFQGACHEVDVTGAFVRGGFDVALEPEGKSSEKVCEFVATHRATNKAYSVEAKSRHVPGVRGYPEAREPGTKPEPQVSRLIRKALEKVAAHDRVICIDVNFPELLTDELTWRPIVRGQVDDLEAEGCGPALLLFSNYPFHYLEPGSKAQGHGFMLTGLSEPRFRPDDITSHTTKFPGLYDVMMSFQKPVPGQWE